MFPKAANKLVGTKFKVVLGYPGSAEILLAMERGEAQGFCGIGWTFLKLRKADWLRGQEDQHPVPDVAARSIPSCPTSRPIIDYAKTSDDRKVFEFLFAPQEMGRPFFAPPGVPAGARAGAARGLRADARRTRSSSPTRKRWASRCSIVGGEEIDMLVERIYASPPEVITRAKAVAE